MILSAANTFNGGVNINAGTVALSAATGAANAGGNVAGFGTGTVAINTGGTAWIHLSTTGPSTVANALTLNGGTLHIEDGATTFSGLVNAAAATTVQERWGDLITFSNVISGAGALTFQRSASGTTEFPVFLLSGVNTNTGTVTAGANATVRLGNAAGLGTTAAGTTVASGGVLDLNGLAIGAEAVILNGTGISSGGALINSSATAAGLGGAINLGSNSSIGAGGITLGGIISGGFSLSKEAAGTLTLNGANTFTGGTTVNGGTLQLNVGGGAGAVRGAVTVNSSGTLSLTAANALGFTTGTKVDTLNIVGGTVNNTAVGDNGWNIAINMTGGTLQSNGGTSSATATQLFTLGAVSSITTNANATAATIGGRLHLREGNTSNQVTFTVADGAAATDLAVTAAITESAAGFGIAKAGPGLMSLTGANAYTGATTVSAGTLQAGNATAFGTTAGGVSVTSGAVVDLNGQTIGAEAFTLNGTGISLGGALINSSGTAASLSGAITLGSNSSIGGTGAGVMSLTGIISGGFGVTKVGAGSVTLSGVNTYTGVTTLSGGILRATTSVQALGTGVATLSLGGGTLQLANDTGLNFARNTTVTANSTISSDRLTPASPAVTHTLGTLSIGGQTLSVTRGANATTLFGQINFGAVTMTGNSVFDPQANAQLLLGAVGGAVPLTKIGAGILELNGAGSYSGITDIQAARCGSRMRAALATVRPSV